jgi:LCP family protein required for cell wall assembly
VFRVPSPAFPHDQPTQVLPTLPPEYEPGPSAPAAPGPRAVGCLAPLLLLCLAALLLSLAGALLLAPTRETVLIVGSDARPDELRQGQIGRTDTLLTLVADRATPKVAMVSVPRDLWVPIPGHGEERVNTAYQLGGPQAATQAVGAVLGLRIDRYALIGLQGVRDVVDAVGGVDITVDQAIHDPAYPTDDYGVIEVLIPAGRQHMDGETALRYARTRHQDSDFGRIARQQRVLAAVRAALLAPVNWPRIPAVVAAVQRSVQTDLTLLDFVAIGAAFLRAPGEPDRLVIDTTLVEPITGQGGAYLLSPGPGLQRAVARFLGSIAAGVEVLNGASVAGIARATADRLSQQGFEIAHVGNADHPLRQTMVAARPEARRAADAVARTLGLPVGRVSEAPDLPVGVDVRVVVGSDLAR